MQGNVTHHQDRFVIHALVQYTPQGLVTYLYVTVDSSFTRYVLQVGCTDAGIINGIEVTLYNDCGWSPNDNTYDIGAVDHIDNGETCTDCSYNTVTMHMSNT